MTVDTQAVPCPIFQIRVPRWCGHSEVVTTNIEATADRLSWYAATGRTAHIRCQACIVSDRWPVDLPTTGVGVEETPVQTTTMPTLGKT